jgi:hypothetical protein
MKNIIRRLSEDALAKFASRMHRGIAVDGLIVSSPSRWRGVKNTSGSSNPFLGSQTFSL